MRIVFLTDTHGDTLNLERMRTVLASSDLAVLVGDITNFGSHDDAVRVVDAIRRFQPNVYAVSGNCDYQDIDAYLDVENMNIHGKFVRVEKGLHLAGLGGSQITPFETPNEYQEKDYVRILEEMGKKAEAINSGFILAAHNPPQGTACDRLKSGISVGSVPVRRFIEKHSPLACVCGHIHESQGTDMIGDTLIINPGPAKDGYYAIMEISGSKINADIKRAPRPIYL